MGKIKNRIQDMLDYTCEVFNIPNPTYNYALYTPSWFYTAFSNKIRFSNQKVIDPILIQSKLKDFWPTSTHDEAVEVLTILKNDGSVSKIQGSKSWRVNRKKAPSKSNTGNKVIPALPKGQSKHQKMKTGQCLKCGSFVRNKNRHNNKHHTTDECKLNIIRSIIEE